MRLAMNEFAFGQTQEQFANFEKAHQQEAPKRFARKQQPLPEEATAQQIFHVRNMINDIIVVQPPTEQERVSQQSREQQGSIGEVIGSAIIDFIFDLIAGGKKVFGKKRPAVGEPPPLPLGAVRQRKTA